MEIPKHHGIKTSGDFIGVTEKSVIVLYIHKWATLAIVRYLQSIYKQESIIEENIPEGYHVVKVGSCTCIKKDNNVICYCFSDAKKEAFEYLIQTIIEKVVKNPCQKQSLN